MRLRASIFGHPIHPMIIPFPIGLFIFSLFSDLVYRALPSNPVWNSVAFYCMAGGIVTALLAAIPGFIDYVAIHTQPAKTTATAHMAINLLVVVLYALNLGLRWTGTTASILPLILSIAGVILLGISGWLGGEMVYVQRMAVEEPAATNIVRQPVVTQTRVPKPEKHVEEEELEEVHK